jgi:hypothetical protein
MALTINHPFDEACLQSAALDASTGKAILFMAPFRGRILKVGTMLGSVLSTADATATTTIAGTAVTGATWVITQSGSAIGDVDFATLDGVGANSAITGANAFNEGDVIKIAMTGSGTAGGTLQGFVCVRRT